MSGHTPGPWKAYEASERCPLPAGCFVEVGTERCRGAKHGTICEMIAQGEGKYDPVATAANARLIAAAPELLEACKEMLARGGSTHERGEWCPTETYRKMQAAIAKAEGK